MEKTTHCGEEIPGVCLCIRRGVGFREVNQRKSHLCKGTAAWTIPREASPENPQCAWQALGICHKEGWQPDLGGMGGWRGFAPFTLMPGRAEPCLGLALDRRDTFELSASLIYFLILIKLFYSWRKKKLDLIPKSNYTSKSNGISGSWEGKSKRSWGQKGSSWFIPSQDQLI